MDVVGVVRGMAGAQDGDAVAAVKREKAHIRRQMLEKRRQLPADYCRDAQRAILERLVQMEGYAQADVVFTYVGRAGEVDTRPLILRALSDGKRVAAPRCHGEGIMNAFLIHGMEELEPGAYGILEPVRGCAEIGPEEIGLAVIPCVCCTGAGLRLGYGGGYYDRYLPESPAVRAALCWERLVVEDLPAQGHDCAMDFVVTEERVLECSRRPSRGGGQEDCGGKENCGGQENCGGKEDCGGPHGGAGRDGLWRQER